MTLAACPPGSKADDFLQQLCAVVSQAGTDTALVLNLRQDSGSMVFEAKPVPPLTNTVWQVRSYNNGRGGVTTLLADTSMIALFRDDGTSSGSSGCNTYSGMYTVHDTSISIGPLVTTLLACAPEVIQQEQAFLPAAGVNPISAGSWTVDYAELRRRRPRVSQKCAAPLTSLRAGY